MKILHYFFKQKPPTNLDDDQITSFFGQENSILISNNRQRYKIEHLIGTGGFADVYKVKSSKGKIFALKILRMWMIPKAERCEVLQRFDREFRYSGIESRYLVRSYDKGKHNGNPFFVMDYCAYGSLRDRIGNFASNDMINSMAVNILNGLHDLHNAGIIHRDLKPENILFNSENFPLLTDFGISGFLKSRMTVRNWNGNINKIFGTIVYLPPEQLNPKSAFLSLGPVTDIFSFGVTMHQYITGEFPCGEFIEGKEHEYLHNISIRKWDVFEKYKASIPAVWRVIITKCLQPDPSHRFQSAKEIIECLDLETYNISKSEEAGTMEYLALKMVHGGEQERIFNLNDICKIKSANIISIGWFDSNNPGRNDIELKENDTNYISARHAALECFNRNVGPWIIRDGQCIKRGNTYEWVLSRNGVFVNDQKVSSDGYPIKCGDIITIGNTRLKVVVIK